jgi:hypothetical protein
MIRRWNHILGLWLGSLEKVGAEEIGNGIWKVFYRDVFLGYFNENDIRVKQQSIRLSSNLV